MYRCIYICIDIHTHEDIHDIVYVYIYIYVYTRIYIYIYCVGGTEVCKLLGRETEGLTADGHVV